MEIIEKLNLHSLRNSEHPRVYNRLVAIVDKYTPETLHLTGPLNRVKAHLPELAKIEAQEQGNALSRKLESIDQRRDNVIRAITGLTEALATGDLPQNREHVARVQAFINKHDLSSMPSSNYTSETEKIADMLADAQRNTELLSSLAALNLDAYSTELVMLNNEFESLFMQRTAETAVQIPVDSKTIRLAADKDMRQLFTFIELFQVEYPDLDYIPLVTELNTLLKYYVAQLAARSARKASGEKTENEPPIPEP